MSYTRQRLDRILVERGLAPSRERARALIMAGVVEVDGMTAAKAGQMVNTGVSVTLREPDHPYVSRGALKLAAGLDAFGVNPAGRVAIDVGASTGGFTDLLLRRGAARVYAVDVGYGQLDWRLRNHPKVVVLERENIRYLEPARIPEPCELAVIDVSFISLALVLPRVAEILGTPGGRPIVALVKPQFEAGKEEVGKGGVIRDPEVREAALRKVRAWASSHRFGVGPQIESPLRGPAGNVEYLLLLHSPDHS
jgi:23S rRNA (cytidine1920-2'-O)/16S rRNA (cytidine1409-2'-O)-methyltransferase